ncbi:MAG: SGNH/GDSL hydrolase family protein [Gordonia sp. (in: high G+C Gram-positive bacteria)]|uniref:SGNH/GDSL hydrolase family protein n=1 Tax=Gordonia sp. (in: high G+C Gram-positive bacteria) TaxID=84139 RepID=UPI0039E2E04F
MRRILALASGLLAAGAVVAAPAAAAPADEYVALGDSAAAGPLISPQDRGAPGCLRSERNYPTVIAARLGLRLTDATCSSAKSQDVYRTQQRTTSGAMPVQTTKLSGRTKLVTLTVGLNDVGAFPIALSCVDLPGAQPCSQRYRRGGHDQLMARIDGHGPAWGRMLGAIKRSAPNAKVAVIGYGNYIRKGGCASQPVKPADADYLQSVINRANKVMAAQAKTRGMQFIDIVPIGRGHDMCAPANRQYEFGLVPSGVGVPIHPTALGMAAIGRYAARTIER